MRKPALRAFFWLLLFAMGLTLVAHGDAISYRGPSTEAALSFAIGAPMLVISPFFLIRATLLAIGNAKLMAGGKIIARWHVSADAWQAFRKYDARRTSQDPALANDFTVLKAPRDRGVDVIVGERQLVVDGSYHVLRPRGLPELRGVGWLGPPADPECIEFRIAYPSRYGTRHMCLRVPVSVLQREEARRTFFHFQRIIPPPKEGLVFRDPTRAIRIGLLMAVVGTAMTGVAAMLFSRGAMGDGVIILLGVGLGAVVGGLLVSAIALVVRQTSRR
ncbi:hypothetical protein ACFB49_47280 [Sphingomonas sp. DBB INV C78]|uniref:hypothetical protein n=1 Tax=Sphingomonas sp. DBB INV C78 TaxID=3349434 RepID=UPI0036D3FFE9